MSLINFCPQCGRRMPVDAPPHMTNCPSCGASLVHAAPRATPVHTSSPPASDEIQNYLVHSILVTLFCCMPLGIPAIVYAARVDSKWKAGDVIGARADSASARQWCKWSFLSQVILIAAYIGAALIGS